MQRLTLSQLNSHLRNNSYYTASVQDYALHPHNIFLAFWLYGGLLSLVGFVWLIVAAAGQLAGSKVDWGLRLGLLAALGAILLQGLFDTTYFKNDLALIFWLIIALIAILEKE